MSTVCAAPRRGLQCSTPHPPLHTYRALGFRGTGAQARAALPPARHGHRFRECQACMCCWAAQPIFAGLHRFYCACRLHPFSLPPWLLPRLLRPEAWPGLFLDTHLSRLKPAALTINGPLLHALSLLACCWVSLPRLFLGAHMAHALNLACSAHPCLSCMPLTAAPCVHCGWFPPSRLLNLAIPAHACELSSSFALLCCSS